MTLSIALGTLEAVMLAGVRIVAFLVIAPPFNHKAIPTQVKVMLALGLAIAVAPTLEGTPASSTPAYVGVLAMQVVIGAALGFLVSLVFSAVAAAGSLIDLSGGFQMAQGFDPGSMVNGAQFARLFHMTALVLLFASGAYQIVLGGLVRTFDALPIGETLSFATLGDTLTTALTGMFIAALQIAGPLVVVLFLADAALGLVTRVAPALNAFVLGFPLKIYLTLTLGVFVFLALPRVVESLTGTAVGAMLGVAGGS